MGIRSWIAERFTGQPVMTDVTAVIAAWGDRSARASRRLVTVAEARTRLAALDREDKRLGSALSVLEDHCRRRELREGDVVGDTADVHHIIPPHHAIGFVLEEADDGYSLETVEMLHCRFSVLRRGGRLVGVGEIGVLRHESYGPCSVI